MFIFSNLATSIDGKIATRSRVHFPLGTREDRRMMGVIRAKADAILVGAGTLRTFHRPMLIDLQAPATSARVKSPRSKEPINVVMSSSLEGLSPNWEFFTCKKTRKILFVSSEAPPHRIRKFEATSEVIVLDRSMARKPISLQVVQRLEDLGVKKLLIEGGGGIMWEFAKLNLIDEYYVTLTPLVLGGVNAPTLVDGEGFGPKNVLHLKLHECRRFGDELYLVYRKTSRRGSS